MNIQTHSLWRSSVINIKKTLSSDRFWSLYVPIWLTVLTIATYLPSLWYDFQFDDRPNILKFYDIRHHTFASLFFKSTRWISYWINTVLYNIGGYNPLYYRLFNLSVHLINGALIYFILRKLLARVHQQHFIAKHASLIAAVTMALFLLHPVQTQTITYIIQGQLEGCAALFCLSIIALFIVIAERQQSRISYAAIALLPVIATLASGTKEIAIITPLLVLLVDWFFFAKGSVTALKKRWYVHALLALVTFGCYGWLLGGTFFLNAFGLKSTITSNFGNLITESLATTITPYWYFISQFRSLVHYLWIYLAPIGLCADYDWRMVNGFADIDVWLPFLLLTAIALFTGWLLYKNKIAVFAFGVLWFFISMAPRTTIVPSNELVNDYKTYLASFGWLLLIAIALVWLLETYAHKKPLVHALAGFLLLSTLCISTYSRNQSWSSGYAFWKDVTEKAPTKARAYNNLGVHALELDNKQEAVWAFRRAISIEPNTFQDPYINLGAYYDREGEHDLAILMLRRAIMINPNKETAWFNLGNALQKSGSNDLAEKAYEQAVAIAPHYGKAWFALGTMALERQDKTQAHEYFKESVTNADVDFHPEALQAYAQTSLELGYFTDAQQAFAHLRVVFPHDITAAINEANCAFLAGNPEESFNLYSTLSKRVPVTVDPRPLYHLGEVCCAMNRFKDGLACFNEVATVDHSPRIQIQRAWCLMNSGDPEQARQILMQLTSLPMDEHTRSLCKQLLAALDGQKK